MCVCVCGETNTQMVLKYKKYGHRVREANLSREGAVTTRGSNDVTAGAGLFVVVLFRLETLLKTRGILLLFFSL